MGEVRGDIGFRCWSGISRCRPLRHFTFPPSARTQPQLNAGPPRGAVVGLPDREALAVVRAVTAPVVGTHRDCDRCARTAEPVRQQSERTSTDGTRLAVAVVDGCAGPAPGHVRVRGDGIREVLAVVVDHQVDGGLAVCEVLRPDVLAVGVVRPGRSNGVLTRRRVDGQTAVGLLRDAGALGQVQVVLELLGSVRVLEDGQEPCTATLVGLHRVGDVAAGGRVGHDAGSRDGTRLCTSRLGQADGDLLAPGREFHAVAGVSRHVHGGAAGSGHARRIGVAGGCHLVGQ